MQPQVLVKLWRNYFISTHVLSVLIAVVYIVCSVWAGIAEGEVLGDFPSSKITHSTSVLFITIGCFLIFSAAIGVAAQLLKNRPGIWLLYCCLVTFLTVAELIGSIAVLSSIGVHKATRNALRKTMEDYDAEILNDHARYWDKIQQKFKCCGTTSYTDWQDVPFGRTTLRTPTSCCLRSKRKEPYCSHNVLPDHKDLHKKIYTEGCMQVFTKKIDVPLYFIGVIGIIMGLAHSVRTYLVCYVVITRRF